MTSERNDLEALAAKVGMYYHDGNVNLCAPLYAFTPTELQAFAARLQAARVPEGHPQAPMPPGWVTLAVPCGSGRDFVHGPAAAIEACRLALLAAAPAPEAETAKGEAVSYTAGRDAFEEWFEHSGAEFVFEPAVLARRAWSEAWRLRGVATAYIAAHPAPEAPAACTTCGNDGSSASEGCHACGETTPTARQGEAMTHLCERGPARSWRDCPDHNGQAAAVKQGAWAAIVQHCVVSEAVTPDPADPYGTVGRLIDYHAQQAGSADRSGEVGEMAVMTLGAFLDAAEAAMKRHRLQGWTCEDSEPLPLVDMLTSGGKPISEGWHQINLICDSIMHEVERRQAQRTGSRGGEGVGDA